MVNFFTCVALSTIAISTPINNSNEFTILENQEPEYYEALKQEMYNKIKQEPRNQDEIDYYDFNNEEIQSLFPSPLYTADNMTCIKIAANLSNRDGLGSLVLTAIEAEANGADSESKDWANSNFITSQYIDCARHFLWNFRSIKNILVNKEETRIFTINYEWANILLDAYKSEYDVMYDDYLSRGYTDQNAQSAAAADGYYLAYRLRGVYAGSSLQSYSFFKSTFNNDNIMDLHNNFVGRDMTDEISGWLSNAKKTAFTTAKNRGSLIVKSSDVTENQILEIYNNASYWYK